jgi:hypothetical protein
MPIIHFSKSSRSGFGPESKYCYYQFFLKLFFTQEGTPHVTAFFLQNYDFNELNVPFGDNVQLFGTYHDKSAHFQNVCSQNVSMHNVSVTKSICN